MAKFSSVLQLTELDDFIVPSQDCIKPLVDKQINKDVGHNKSSEELRSASQNVKKAQITLNDCLACSGCITSAESILITQQSQQELYKILKSKTELECLVVVSVSPQSRASLASKYNLTMDELAGRLTTFFKQIGVDLILDVTDARNVSLMENCQEFIRRYKERANNLQSLPMLASSCPGWICYAEKTHGNFVLPFLSRVKSPQQVMGSFVKHFLGRKFGKSAAEVYHCTVMPCYDKKLEASRQDFYDEVRQTREVDCVITTGEVEEMLMTEEVDLRLIPSSQLDHLVEDLLSYQHAGSASGGYLEHIFRFAAFELFQQKDVDLHYQVLRNQDLKEVLLEIDGEVKLRFAIAYGFRNIQNIIQKLKRKKFPYDFVEIMACPSGCLNGGGQLKQDGDKCLSDVDACYSNLPVVSPWENPVSDLFYSDWLHNEEKNIASQLYTNYHPIAKMVTAFSIKW